ncbi:hypothetical protein GCM10019016_062030 [Streptomyces prasinosporus]|uniref:Uncharacterized protein n=2 Tax=Streptomyces prasinosporus TaxID=68256 RepID=A0ABP6TWF1_9ACTN
MNNIAVAKKQLPQEQQDQLLIVFVTTDPERDTRPPRSASGSRASTPQVVGLTGDFATIQAGARTLGISIDPPRKDDRGQRLRPRHPGRRLLARRPTAATSSTARTPPSRTMPEDLPALIKG